MSMITQLQGTIALKKVDYITLDVNGVGYKIYTSRIQSIESKSKQTIFTHLYVGSDNQPSLYGFLSTSELDMFTELLSVQGVGPKIALKIVESDSTDNIEKAIIDGNINYLTKIKGLGKKGAQKIILELKNTLIEDTEYLNDQEATIKDALESLGFNKGEITKAMNKIDISSLKDEDAIEKLLQLLGK